MDLLSDGAGVALASTEKPPFVFPSFSSDGQHTPRKPSALQVSVIANPTITRTQGTIKGPKSPATSRSYNESPEPSPQSPRSKYIPGTESPKSPRERLEDFLRLEDPQIEASGRSRRVTRPNALPTEPSKAQSYSQLRNISSPLPDATSLGHSSPPSPRSSASPPHAGSPLRPQQAPRTSSIDSAISSISSTITHSPKSSSDSNTPASPDVSGLIKAAGSPENLIARLLREKQHSEGRTAQLWSLVEKQRKLLLGLNEDLHKAGKDKERYRKELEDLKRESQSGSQPTMASPRLGSKARDRSQTPSESSAGLPIQRQSQESSDAEYLLDNNTTPRAPQAMGGADARMQPTTAGADTTEERLHNTKNKAKHAHIHTSSSDLGVFKISGPAQDMPALQTRGLDQSDSPSQTSPQSQLAMSSTGSFTAKRSQPYPTKPFPGPTLTLTESTPTGNDTERMTPPRKAPPAPLDLDKPKKAAADNRNETTDKQSDSEYEDEIGVDELTVFERGRKKTREEDDLEREILQKQHEEERSRSKKQKSSKSRSGSEKSKTQILTALTKSQALPLSPPMKALAPEPTPALAPPFLSQPASLAGMLDPGSSQQGSEAASYVRLPMVPLSPGLPLSPRPGDRPVNAPTPRLPRDADSAIAPPPLSPNQGFIGLPLSPRAPKQPFPYPPHTPISMAPPSPAPPVTESYSEVTGAAQLPSSPTTTKASSEKLILDSDSSGTQINAPNVMRPRGVSKRLVSEAYPGLLLPPNALLFIKVNVISSRLKPSRQSLVFKGDDEPAFTLGVAARSDERDLWKIERPILSLHNLDQQLRQTTKLDVKLPERSLFNGHAPAKVDARRIALEKYFEILLDTQMDEKAALVLCQYLSTNASEPIGRDTNGLNVPASPKITNLKDRPVKEGFLTKRGKNFGGWKARYFVLKEPLLRYHEEPNGPALGTIKLHRAKIGKQSPPKASGSGDESDGQYRHAFLIREPKKKDSNSYIDHVLCAESDVERDAWVAALMAYVSAVERDQKARPRIEKNDSGSGKIIPQQSRKTSSKQNGVIKDSPDSEDFDNLQCVPYEETRAAQPPHVRITPDPRPEEPPSPTTSGQGSHYSDRAPSAMSKAISGPQNGVKISDAGAWGNKPMTSPLPGQNQQKKRSLFGFHNKDSNSHSAYDPLGPSFGLNQSQLQYQEQITNVKAAFGAPLAESAEYCGPRGVGDVCLPAVVYRCLQYLEAKNAAKEEGIFRMNGSNTLVKTLKARFNNEGDFDMLASGQSFDVNAVASLLKQYLRELPAPVLTTELHLELLQVLEMNGDRQKAVAFNSLVHRLPKPNYHLLRALSAYLVTIVLNSESNKMDVRNLGIVFSPTLHIPAPVIQIFVEEFDTVFREPTAIGSIPSSELRAPQTLTAEDIRSPRRQMFSDIPTPAFNQTVFTMNQQPGGQETASNGIHSHQDLGFAPLQPSYDGMMRPPQPQSSFNRSDSGFTVVRPRNIASGDCSTKQNRRESSMLLMGPWQKQTLVVDDEE